MDKVKYYIGIDPGVRGGLAIIQEIKATIILCGTPRFELTKKKNGKTVKNFVCDERGMANLLKPYIGNAVATIEKVHTMPEQGVVSQGKLMESYGLWKGMLAMADIPFECVAPQTWKKAMMPDMDKSSKDASRMRAKQLWIDKGLFDEVKDEHVAEAALIAEYCRRNYFKCHKEQE